MATASVATPGTRTQRALTLDEVDRLEELCLWINAVAGLTGATSVVGGHHAVADDAILNATWLIRELSTEVRAIVAGTDAHMVRGLTGAARGAASGRGAQA